MDSDTSATATTSPKDFDALSRTARGAGMGAILSLEIPRVAPPKQRDPECFPGCYATASLAALTARALTTLRAGLALKTVSRPVNGLMPLRSLVAGFFTTNMRQRPGTTKRAFFFSSMWPIVATDSRIPLTSLRVSFPSDLSAMVWIRADLDRGPLAIFTPLDKMD